MSAFKKAERKKAKLRLGISGVSGSGKTYSALTIATGMGGKIAMIDTESGRGELYGEEFEYDILQVTTPYSPHKYVNAIKEAEKEGYDILIIDSLSHAWAGEGGILSMVEKAGGSFSAWGKIGTPQHNLLIDTIIASSMHIIFTMRSKADYVMETTINKQGKETQAPKKVGMAPIQREGLEYECTIYMDMNLDHIAHVTKDNTKIYDQQFVNPTKEMGEKLMEWLNTGKEALSEGDKWLDALRNSTTLEELQYHFIESSRYAKSSNNQSLLQKLIQIKDSKKEEIQDALQAMAEQMKGEDDYASV